MTLVYTRMTLLLPVCSLTVLTVFADCVLFVMLHRGKSNDMYWRERLPLVQTVCFSDLSCKNPNKLYICGCQEVIAIYVLLLQHLSRL